MLFIIVMLTTYYIWRGVMTYPNHWIFGVDFGPGLYAGKNYCQVTPVLVDTRMFISLSVAKTIATALITTRLDYCNSLLHNIAIKDIAKLQRVQNCLARVVTRSPRFSRSVPLLKSLHWLPVHYRIIFKICTIAYQALSSTQPAYLNSMLTPARNSRQLRSTSSNPLYIPRVKTNAGTRAFSVAAPTVWNSLPASVKSEANIVSFRRRLKTYLFNAAYPP